MKHLNAPIPTPLDKRLQKYVDKNGILKKKVLELALTEYLDKHENK